MWFVVVLLCAVAAAQSSDNQVGPLNGERHFPAPRPVSEGPTRPRWQRKNGPSAFKPEQMNPWNPDSPPEEQDQNDSDGSPFGKDATFIGWKRNGNRGEEVEWRRSESNLNQDTLRNGQWDKWSAAGKPQRSGRSGRLPYRPEKMPVLYNQAPVDGGRGNEMDQFLGKPLSPSKMDNRQFIPIFKAENVTLQNISTYHLKEGDNIFLLPKAREKQLPLKGGVKRPQEMGYNNFFSGPQPYVKLIYNPTATQRISFEYGITQLLPSFMKAETDSN